MPWLKRARALSILAIAAGAMVLPWESFARHAPEPAPPPPPAPAGPVALPARTLADAAAYQAFMERVGAASPAFTGAANVAQTLKDAAAYEPVALVRDAVAYAAIAALQDQTWVNALREAGNSPENRRLMAGYIMADGRYALMFKGADGAAGLAREALASGAMKLFLTGKAVRQASYDIQHQAWSKADVAARPARLAMVEAEGRSPLPDAPDHIAALQQAETGAAPMGVRADPLASPYTPLVAAAVQLAAVAALGEASDELYDRLAGLAADRDTNTCLHIARLNLNQCLAVAKPNYEDVFCTGQHAMMDTGACLVRNAGLSVPVEPPVIGPEVKFVARRITPVPAHHARRARKR
ncbi:MAG TPA: hypothetical protein VGN38_07265 [Caulobacteraceae bacterium]|nr:hypothetical protein [Caulobacteraceae bacterium]